MDKETSQIQSDANKLLDLTQHEGWGVARAKLVDKILDLQNAFNLQAESPEKMFIELQARKMASNIMYEWLRDVEGTAEQSKTEFASVKRSYIIMEE